MKHKKQLAAKVLGTSYQKIRFADGALEEVKKAITRSDMRGLIAVGKVYKSEKPLHSRAHARMITVQKRKGRRQGRGNKKGKKNAIVTSKNRWIMQIRVQREFLGQLREKGSLSPQNYQRLYRQSKGGYFRNKRHIKLYLTEHNLLSKKGAEK
ncbi:MAG: large subunit ribosomal protein L19e [archaeon GW2011_AR9]|nr:MAG: large subunit ribosomal protein L19e [archaeon GW2011_AR9]MBS3120279.1 50S ribosomal protein L19e [Candidatus Woesearchaeota archaeon]HIG92976.1 50S ribosomal protein L19e [Candidatus Woesearchaeota archaeon]HIH12709.1 50S ribosomal protein L19e [Candidatus Woesearchaeota archaeon]